MPASAARTVDKGEARAIRRQRLLLGGALLLLTVAGGILWYRLTDKSAGLEAANRRMYMCSETNQTFWHDLEAGDEEPITSPYTKRRTGWLAEKCYWTRTENGGWKAKSEPTYVIVKKSEDGTPVGRTYCPDCKHEVVGHNRKPEPDEVEPPPDSDPDS